MNLPFPAFLEIAALLGPPIRRDTPIADESEDFHAHLDRCQRCSDHPFALCEKYVGLPKCQDCGWKLDTDITNSCLCSNPEKHRAAIKEARELQTNPKQP